MLKLPEMNFSRETAGSSPHSIAGVGKRRADLKEKEKITKILDENADKDFVKRIQDPENSPSIDMGKDEAGNPMRGTHFMASGESDGRFYAYPTIQTMPDGTLKKMEANEAFKQAMETGDLIEFATDEEAKWFAKSYKKVWER